MSKNVLCVLFLSIISIINAKVIKLKLDSKVNKKDNDFHPFRISFDFTQLKKQKNKKYVNKLKKSLNQISRLFSQFINIKNNKLIKTSLLPKFFCDSRIKFFNKKLKKGFKTDLLIYPIIVNTKDKRKISSKICAVDVTNNRPIIATLIIQRKRKYKNIASNIYYLKIINHLIHILGFNEENFHKSNILRGNKLKFNYFKNLNEKLTNIWGSIALDLPKCNYHFLKNDIMSKKKKRMPVFSYITLAILQRVNFYQINLSSCGCSLNGDCDYLKNLMYIFFYENLNGDLNYFCYLNKNINSKCNIINDTLIHKTFSKKVNKKEYSNFFNGNHSINKLVTWESSIPKIKNPPQIINLLSPKENGKCKNPQRTLFFYYPNYLNVTNLELKNYKIEPYIIKNKNMTVYHTYIKENDRYSFYRVMNFNKIPFSRNYFLSNFLSYFFNGQKIPEVIGSLGKYQVYNSILNSVRLFGNKVVLYRNYRYFKNRFPKDFDFHPESFILSEDKELMAEKFKNYTQTENDLWIYKPPKGSLGLGIKLLKTKEDFQKYSFINRYISNPHLLYGRKYHIRMYVVVTGILPLKIYVFNEGQVMQASSDYIYNLSEIENRTSMLTNIHQNFQRPGYNNNVTFDREDGSQWTIKTLSKFIERKGGNWTKLWEGIKDISVKTILISYGEMQKTILENYSNIRSNNLIHRYGFDIMIDDNLKPWLLEVNTKPAMNLYNIINEYNKIKIEADRINLIGMVPFNHYTQEPLDKEMIYKDKIDEGVQLSICEFERPQGGLERIFPVKKTLNYYKQFIEYHDEYNKALWDFIENNEI